MRRLENSSSPYEFRARVLPTVKEEEEEEEDTGLWKCSRSKSTVVFLLCLFVIEVFAAAAIGLGIYYSYQDGTLPPPLFGTNCSCRCYQNTGMQEALQPEAETASSYLDYQGSVDANGRKSGFGMTFYADRRVAYQGLWVNDKRNGLGTSYFHQGQGEVVLLVEAQGYWQNDRLSGLAIRYYNATHHYSGQFHDDQRSGHGLEYVKGNLVYEGQFKEDARWGYGTQYTEAGQVLYAGDWRLGKHHGHGTEYLAPHYRGQWASGLKNDGFGRDRLDGEDNYYEGHFVNGLRQGHGVLVMPNNNYSYDGQWLNDKMDGFGTLHKMNGASYEGYFKANLFHGQGLYVDEVGNVFNGTHENQQKIGLGHLTDIDGNTFSGTWHHGLLHGDVNVICSNGLVRMIHYIEGQSVESVGPCNKK